MSEDTPPPPPVTADDLRDGQLTRRIAGIEDRLDRGADRMGKIEKRLDDAVDELARNSELTQDVRDILTAAKVGLRVLGGIGQVVRWFGILATAGVAIWGAIYAITHGGQLPPKP